jgi:hypothetical protein
MAVGHICEAAQKPDDARGFYHRILQIEPWNLDAQKNLDRLDETRTAI